MRKLLVVLGVAFLMVGMVGCDSGDDGATCSSVGKALCAKACECGGDKCVFEGEGMSMSFDTQADCEALYVGLGCSAAAGNSGFDWDACDLALESAQCGESGFITPTECEDEE